MSLMDEKKKFFDAMLVEYEREFATFSTKMKRELYTFLQAGPYTKAEVIKWFAGTGYTDMAQGFVSKYDDVLEYTARVANMANVPFVLPNRSLDILALFKDNQVLDVLGASDSIIRTVTDASLRYGIGEVKLKTIVSELEKTIDIAGRRIVTETTTGASMYDRLVKFEQFKHADIELYFYDGPVDSKNRDECAATLSDPKQSTGWKLDEISGSGTPFVACGGYNCRHEWLPMVEGMDREIEAMAKEAKAGSIQVGEN